MAEFQYEAYTRQGHRVAGTEMADSRQDLEHLLESRGLLPKSISRKSSFKFQLVSGKKAGSTEFHLFTGELLSLIQSGMGIPEAVGILSDEESGSAISLELRQVHQLIKSGVSFSAACERSPHIFDNLFVSALKTGEQSGDLIRPLQSYYSHLERRIELRRKVSQALTYPIFLVITFAVILALMFVFVVPNFTSLYNDLSADMPALTIWLLNTVENMPVIIVVVVLFSLVLVVGVRMIRSKINGKIWLDKIKGMLPLIGTSYLLLTYWQFTQSLSSLLRGGGNLVYSMRTARDVSGNHYFATQIDKVIHRVSNGESLSKALRNETAIPVRSLKMIAVGEESSNLEVMLDSVSGYFERQLDDRVKRLISLVEPMIMLAIGLIVGIVIVALYLPVFGMVNVIS